MTIGSLVRVAALYVRRDGRQSWTEGCLLAGLLSGFLSGGAPAIAQEILPASPLDPEIRTLGTSEFPRAVWMAVFADGRGTRFLAGGGDPVFPGGSHHPVGVVRSVTPVEVTLAPSTEGREVRVLPGRGIPGAPDLVLRETVLVRTLEFRHRFVPPARRKILEGEFYLAAFTGHRAVLQRDVEPPPSPTEMMLRRLAAIRIVETGPRSWEVSARDVQTAMKSGEAIVADSLKNSRIGLSSDAGVGLEVKTPMVEARLDRRGFVITSPRLAARAGLQVGDRILQVNDVPVDGLGSLLRVYRDIRKSPSIRRVDLLIERDARPLSLSYQVR